MQKKKKGFTLVELLVVIAILAILASVSVVGYLSFTKEAQISADEQAVTEMNTVLLGDQTLNGKPNSASDVKNILRENGYNAELKAYYSKYTLGWLSNENVIVLVENGSIVYPDKFDNYSTTYLVYLNELVVSTKDEFIGSLQELDKADGYVNVKLNNDLELNETAIAIANNNELEIDLNGKNMVSNLSEKKRIALEVSGSADLVLNNGKISSKTADAGLTAGLYVANKGNAKISNMTIESNIYGITTNGSQSKGTSIIIENSVITASIPLYFNDVDGTLILRNSTFNGSTFIMGGNVIIENCTFNGTYEKHCDFTGEAIKLWNDEQVKEEYLTGKHYAGTANAQTGADGAWSYGDGLLIVANRSTDAYLIESIKISNSKFYGYKQEGKTVGFGLRVLDLQNANPNININSKLFLNNNIFDDVNGHSSNCGIVFK